jgi:hypothetical protein
MLRAASSGGSSSSRPGVGHYAALREPESPAEARAPGCGGYPSRRRSHAASGQATRPGRHLAGQGLDLHWLRRHREDLAPPAPGDQPGQCREPQPAGRLAADPAGLAAQHRVSRAGAPGARRPWTPRAGPAPSGRRADGIRAGRPPRRSLRDAPSPQDCPGQARSGNRAPQGRRHPEANGGRRGAVTFRRDAARPRTR